MGCTGGYKKQTKPPKEQQGVKPAWLNLCWHVGPLMGGGQIHILGQAIHFCFW